MFYNLDLLCFNRKRLKDFEANDRFYNVMFQNNIKIL